MRVTRFSGLAAALLMVLLLVLAPRAEAQASSRASVSADSVALTLDEALRRALERSQEVRIARANLDVAKAQVRSARSAALPQINGSVQYTRTFDSPYAVGGSSTDTTAQWSPDSTASTADRLRYIEENAPLAGLAGLGSLFGNLPFGQLNSYTAAVVAQQPLYSAGRVGAALKIADEYMSATQLGLKEQLADLELSTRRAYVQAQLALEMEHIATLAVAQADSFLVQERLRHDAGTSSELDVLRAEVSAENLRPQLIQARNAASLATLELKRLVDIPATQPVRLVSPLEAPTAAALAALTTPGESDVADRAAVRAADRQIAIAEQQVRLATSGFLPKVDLRLSYGRVAYPATVFGLGDTDWRTDFNGVIGVSIPIFSGFKTSADVQQAKVALEQERLKATQLREQVSIQLEQAIGERERAAASLSARRRTVDQAERVHGLTVLRYEQGLATQLEVSDARLMLLQARTAFVQAVADYHLAAASVTRALGETTIIVP